MFTSVIALLSIATIAHAHLCMLAPTQVSRKRAHIGNAATSRALCCACLYCNVLPIVWLLCVESHSTIALLQRGGVAGINTHADPICAVLAGPCGNTTAHHPSISIRSAVPVSIVQRPLDCRAARCVWRAERRQICFRVLRALVGAERDAHRPCSLTLSSKRTWTTTMRPTRARLSSIWR